MSNKTLVLYFVAGIVSFAVLANPHQGYSFDYGSINKSTLPTSNIVPPDQFFGQLPKPVTDFINSAKQINSDLTLKSSSLNLRAINPGTFWNNANTWLERNVGLNLTQIVKGIGDIIVWILSFMLSVFKWALSFLK